MAAQLRALERVITRELDRGVPIADIAMSLRKQPGTVRRIVAMVELANDLGLERDLMRSTDADGFRPVERCIRRLRTQGQSVGEVASRLRRSGEYVRRVESYTRFKESRRDVTG